MPDRKAPGRRPGSSTLHNGALVGLTLFAGVCFAFAFSGIRGSGASQAAMRAADPPVSAPAPAADAIEAPVAPALAASAPVAAVGPEELALHPPPAPPELDVTEGVIAAGESLDESLRAQGVASGAIAVIAREMAPHFDFRRARAGHAYQLVQDEDGRVLSFRYEISTTDSYRLVAEAEGYAVGRDQVPLVARPTRIAGVVTSSLYEATRALGEAPQLASDFAEIFAWDIDFSRSVRPGDAFRILYERLYRVEKDGSEVFVRPGRILAARYDGAAGSHTAVYFEPVEGRGGYYRPDGSSVEGQFLVAPLRYARISSQFTSARRHPILKITRPHHGIDYAAPAGTPIWAVGDGQVIYRGWAGGFGNLVKVRHPKGYVSYYAHLSRFARGLKVGTPVRQKQVIGYVGETGLATGPHVCFRMAKDGSYVDPGRLRTRAGPPVAPQTQPVFLAARDTLLAELDAGPTVATDEAL